jgi:hypothetical protein
MVFSLRKRPSDCLGRKRSGFFVTTIAPSQLRYVLDVVPEINVPELVAFRTQKNIGIICRTV